MHGMVDVDGMSAERRLARMARRWASEPRGRFAVALQLSRMPPPGARPHHRRIAHALMTDEASRCHGELFALGNGDLVLLGAAQGGDVGGLPGVLGRLLHADVADPAAIVSVWPMVPDAAALLTYARVRLAEPSADALPVRSAERDRAAGSEAAHAVATIVDRIDPARILRRQVAVVVAAGRGLVPLFREATLSIAAAEEASGWVRGGGADPFLWRHLAGRLDAPMLAAMTAEIGRGGPLDPTGEVACLHLNLTLATIGSPRFAAFARACADAAATVGVEVAYIEACADPEGLDAARDILARHGMTLVVDGVSHAALRLTRAWTLRPDLLKLDWAPALADLPAADARALELSLHEIGLDHVVLHRAETEAALRWGLNHGIRRFQGRQVDAMLAATRLRDCAHASGCKLGQCATRAGATTLAGRSDCRDPARLDGMPLERALAA